MDLTQERRIVTDIPGPRSRELLERRKAAVPKGIASTAPIFTESASGAIIRDVDGNQLIDLGAGLAVLNVGNSAPAVVEAVRAQLDKFTHTCMHVTMSEPYVELAERLNALVPGPGPKQTMFVNSGAEATENAVKLSRYFTGRPAVAVFDHAFHGRTLMAMTMTAKAMPYKHGFGPFAPEVYRLPMSYPYRCPTGESYDECGPRCADAAITMIDKQIGADKLACVLIEPQQGEGGFIVPGRGIHPEARGVLRRKRNRLHRRRGPDRLRPYRQDVRHRVGGRRARPGHDREVTGRRPAARRRDGPRRDPRRGARGRPRRDVRREPAGDVGRARRARHDRARRPGRARGADRRADDRAAARDGQPLVAHRRPPRSRRDGRHRAGRRPEHQAPGERRRRAA